MTEGAVEFATLLSSWHISVHSVIYWALLLLLVAVIVDVILLPMIVAPIRVHGSPSQVKPARRKVKEIGLEEVPQVFHEYLLRTTRELSDAGFVAAAQLKWDDTGAKVKTYVSIWVNRDTGDIADAVLIHNPAATVPVPTNPHVSFQTRYPDDRLVTTSNWRGPGVFWRNPDHRILRVHWVNAAGDLYRIHRARVAQERHSARPLIPPVGEEIEDHLKRNRRSLEEQVRGGYYSFDEVQQVFRPTWRGAFLMTWKIVIPIKQVRQMLHDRAAAAELRELGIHDACGLHVPHVAP